MLKLNHLKRILSASFLVLLLYNMFGLAIGIFFFEKEFQTATEVRTDDEYKLIKFPVLTLPYNTSWENNEDVAGLFKNGDNFYNIVHQKIENDTAYVILKTNLSARDRFLELADQITNSSQDLSEQTPLRKAIRALADLVKVYWVSPSQTIFRCSELLVSVFSQYESQNSFKSSPFLALLSPPPEY